MPLTNSLIYSSALESAIDRHPLIVGPETPVEDVIALMSQLRGSCPLPTLNASSDSDFLQTIRSSCALVIAGALQGSNIPELTLQGTNGTASLALQSGLTPSSCLLGIFTERDIVRLTAAGKNLKSLHVSEVMTAKVITLNQSDAQDIFTALSLFRQYRIRHLPIIDKQEQLLGIVTPETIRQALQPANLLTQLRYVTDVMNTQVIHAPVTSSVLNLAQQMAAHRVSCVVICQSGAQSDRSSNQKQLTANPQPPYSAEDRTLKIPVGIVTERDIVQFQALDLDLAKMQAQDVMSTPLFCLSPNDSLWFAHEKMQQHRVRRMVVSGTQGELVGIISQTNLLQALDPTEMYGIIEALQRVIEDRTKELQSTNEQLQNEIGERKRAQEALTKAHDDLQKQVEERTAQLQEANALLLQDIRDRQQVEAALRQSEAQSRQQAAQLEKAIQDLQKTQSQLIQAEKMSSLGQLVAGIAHEINNPVNFIYGNLAHASQYIQDLLHLVDLYRHHYPIPEYEIQEEIEDIDLDFLLSDLPRILASMQVGADRIREIVLSLRNFSRLDEAEMKRVNIHEGLDSTLLILQHRLKAKPGQADIAIVKEYADLPLVECYAGPLNQVFMNILSNAIDALETQSVPRTITIRTEVVSGQQSAVSSNKQTTDNVLIRIADNGPGISEEVRLKLFEPFFTTKGVGKGTGLGLSISYQIVVERHNGRLQCTSAPGVGTEFIIEIPVRQPNEEPPLFESSPPSLAPEVK